MTHNWKHMKFCFNRSSKSKPGHFRYNFPIEIHNSAFITPLPLANGTTAHDIFEKRSTRNECINNYNDVILTFFKLLMTLDLLLDCR